MELKVENSELGFEIEVNYFGTIYSDEKFDYTQIKQISINDLRIDSSWTVIS